MTYKDKSKQKQAQREWVRQKRANQQGSTEGSTSTKRGKDIKCFEDLHPEIQATIENISTDKDGNVDEAEKSRRTANAIRYQHLYPDRYEPLQSISPRTLEMTASARANYKPASELGPGEVNHVSKPGDQDYDSICTPEWIAERTA